MIRIQSIYEHRITCLSFIRYLNSLNFNDSQVAIKFIQFCFGWNAIACNTNRASLTALCRSSCFPCVPSTGTKSCIPCSNGNTQILLSFAVVRSPKNCTETEFPDNASTYNFESINDHRSQFSCEKKKQRITYFCRPWTVAFHFGPYYVANSRWPSANNLFFFLLCDSTVFSSIFFRLLVVKVPWKSHESTRPLTLWSKWPRVHWEFELFSANFVRKIHEYCEFFKRELEITYLASQSTHFGMNLLHKYTDMEWMWTQWTQLTLANVRQIMLVWVWCVRV